MVGSSAWDGIFGTFIGELIDASLISSQGEVDQSYVDGHRSNLYTVCIYCREKGSNAAFRRGTTVEIFKNFLKLF